MARKPDGKGARPIIIKREEVVEGGHHGGAWKVAYADFVTAMMAFFLLMWLLNATTEEQRRGLADYFATQGQMARSLSGSGLPFGGRTPYDKGSMVSDRGSLSVVAGKSTAQADTDDDDNDQAPQEQSRRSERTPADEDRPGAPVRGRAEDAQEAEAGQGRMPAAGNQARIVDPDMPDAVRISEQQALAVAERHERAAFEQAAQQIREAVQKDPALADLARQLTIDQTPEGLRIQILDEDKRAMFATGSAVLNDRARLLLQKIAPILAKLTEGISIAGHTDAAPYRGPDRSNWELSSERANATRRLLVDAGVQEPRLRSVTGNADRDLLLPADPLAAANRRIAIVVLRSATLPAAAAPAVVVPPAQAAAVAAPPLVGPPAPEAATAPSKAPAPGRPRP